jgi:PIN domain nuclease of toxin-antitoxin system
VPDLPAAATDTHGLIYYSSRDSRLGTQAARRFAAAERQQSTIYVPAAVMWEISLLARAGRIVLRRSHREIFADLFSNPAFQFHDLTADQIEAADELRVNRDPFDALIVAAARSLKVPLITRDADIRASRAVRVIW